jgi:hypothetical protein
MSEDETPPVRGNPGYILEQLRRAAGLAGEVARERVEAWTGVLRGLADGSLRVGSRTPVEGLPAWVTLRVLHGGFASGDAEAGGALRPHEHQALEGVEVPEGMTERAALNLHYLTGGGTPQLQAQLADGSYRVELPEEAALLMATWLRGAGEEAAALELVEELLPYTDRLRFYPVPSDAAPASGETLWIRSAGELCASLRSRPYDDRVEAQREALSVWTPWADAAVDLFLETMEGDWPLQRFPEGWTERARVHQDRFEDLRAEHPRCGKPDRAKENLAVFQDFLTRAAADAATLTGYEVGRLRRALLGYLDKHGEPGSERRRELRAAQARVAALPAHRDVAQVLARRLADAPAGRGLDDPEQYLAPLSEGELGSAQDVPRALRRRVEAARAGTLEELVEAGLLGSSEQVARQLSTLTANAIASGYEDPALGRLVARTYRAFRNRRSLLLVDLESQVGFGELPWVRAVASRGRPAPDAARATLERAARVVLRSFPHTPTPNKLVKELRALARGAELDVLLCEELAADIFMGTFTDLFLRAAQQAGELLEGSLYARYYALPYEQVRQMRPETVQGSRKKTCQAFDALCRELAGDSGGSWSVAANGTILEQAQLLTTHNLAALHSIAGEELQPEYPELARRCFDWVCHRLQLPIVPWVPRLRNIKNAAFAWRQMVFFLSLAGEEETADFLRYAGGHLHQQSGEFIEVFQPALRGLEAAHGGTVLVDSPEARRFLGWSRGRPWVMGAE